MGVAWKKGCRVLENEAGNPLRFQRDPLQPGDGGRTCNKSEHFVRRRMAHWCGQMVGVWEYGG